MEPIDSQKTALLVIDMQRDFFAEGGNAVRRGKPVTHMQALPEKINHFASQLRAKNAKVIFTKFIYDPARNPANFTDIISQTKKSNWMCEVGTSGAELVGVEVCEQDNVLEKLSYDCFAGTDLRELLSAMKIENLFIAGVRTEICVLATAQRSFAEGLRTFVASDLVGTYDNKQDIANAVLHALAYAAYTPTADSLLKRMK